MINKHIVILLFLLFAGGTVVLWWIVQSTDNEMRSELLQQARIATQAINKDRITSLTGSEKDLAMPAYQRIKQQLALMRKARHQCKFLYLMGQRSDGAIFFLVDSLPEGAKDYAPPGLIYDEISQAYRKVFDTGQEAVVGPVTDRWGTLVTALIPVKLNRADSFAKVLGMDVDAEDWHREIIGRCVGPFMVILLLAVLIFLLASREKTLRTLRRSEEKFYGLFRNMPSGVAIYEAVDDGADFVFKDLNPAAERIENVRYADVVSRRITTVFPLAASSGICDVLRRVWETGGTEYFPESVYQDDRTGGSWRENWVYKLSSGSVVTVYNDITRHKQAEQALAMRLRFERMISRISSEFLWLSAEDMDQGIERALCAVGTISAADRAYVFLYRKGGSLADNTHEWCAEGVEPQIENLKEISVNTELPWFAERIQHHEIFAYTDIADLPPEARLEKVHFQARGIRSIIVIPMVLRKSLVGFLGFDAVRNTKIWTDDDKSMLRLVGEVFTNAIERKRSEIRLRKSESRYRALFDYNPTQTVVVDNDARIRMFNFARSRSAGRTPEIGDVMYKDYAEKHEIDMYGELTDCIQSGVRKDFAGLKYNQRYLNIRLSPFIGGVIITSEDVTEQKTLQDLRGQMRKMEAVGTLSGGIAHEFNNILGIILGNAELAADDIPGENPTHEFLAEIKSASLRGKKIVGQLLSFSRKTDHKMKPLNIADVVRESIRFLRVSIPTSIVFEKNIHDDCKTVLGDKTQIHQVMINLCNNAVHAMEDAHGTLGIVLENVHLSKELIINGQRLEPGDYVRLTVSDTGIGIPEKVKDQVFDPYFTTKPVDKGTGMGLAVVYGIMRGHEGLIHIESRFQKGSRVFCYFPVAAADPVPVEENSEALPKGSESILFVDDDAALAKIGKQRLERLGYTVESMTDSLTALAAFKNNPEKYDLVITDMTMPQMTGDQFIMALKNIRADIKTIICTGYSKKCNAETAEEIGVSGYLMKPVDREKLAETVRAVLDDVRDAGWKYSQ